MAYLSYKYRLYPNDEQKKYFMKTFGCVRLVYNRCLELEQQSLCRGEGFVSQKELLSFISSVLLVEYPFLADVDFSALCYAAFHLIQAYKMYWNHILQPPVFKTRKNLRNSFSTGSSHFPLAVGSNCIYMPKAGRVKASIHRPLPDSSKLLSFTISKEPDDSYYCSVMFSYNQRAAYHKRDPEKSIGLDYRVKGLYVDSNGVICNAPRYNLKSEKKLKRAQRKLSRMEGFRPGELQSKNYKKQLKKVNKIYRKAVNSRNDFLHKKAAALSDKYDFICAEDLALKEMAANDHGLGKSTMDNSYRKFLEILNYKLYSKGNLLIKVDRWFPSSQLCSSCGYRQKLPLNRRVFVCPRCGMVLDRDVNAAINIRSEGMKLINKYYIE